ncbi:MAG: transposase [Pseudonocardiaceae bacterium]
MFGVVADQAAVAHQPAEGSFHDPAAGQDDESGGCRRKKINGRTRHIAVDTLGLLLLVVMVTAASVQDRDGACRLLALLRERFCTITLVWADGGYAGRLVNSKPQYTTPTGPWTSPSP